ncbi:hypothetical protein [Flavobacterium aestuarii]|uniref:hypothetical protein n=1 Tax=Flavobacterium aestuarii TaxID=3149227 RepID=UPI0032B5BB49
MTITKKDLQIIIPFILFVGIGIYSAFSVEFILRDKPIETTLKWFAIPSLVLAIYYAYRATFGYKQDIKTWRKAIGMLVYTIICSAMFIVAFQGFLIIYNCNIGQQNDYLLKGTITKIVTTESKSGRISYSILVHRELENDNVNIDIPENNYTEGQLFSKQMKIGSLGFIYSN